MKNLIKHFGQVFTPEYLVENILNVAGYIGKNIEKKHFIDNSCGDGAFLCEAITRYIENFFQSNKGNNLQLKNELEKYIHGIEKDAQAHNICIENLNMIAAKYNLFDVSWDIVCGDALVEKRFNGKMDYVIGNPPYVRVHNLDKDYSSVKQFSFSQTGMTDLYLVFFEIGFNMLSQHGRLCYITPSSWINSVAGGSLRTYILNHHNLLKLIDLEHYQPFVATTYTMISLFSNDVYNDGFMYAKYNPDTNDNDDVARLSYNDVCINGIFYLASHKTLISLKNILSEYKTSHVKVKNGFATLSDNIFIRDSFPFSDYIIPVIKGSTGKWYQCFFPYDKNGKPLSYDRIFSKQQVANYLLKNQTTLLKKSSIKENPYWYLFGRTQALKDVFSNKYAINTCIKDINSIKFNQVPAGSGIYSGLYILTNIPENKLREIIFCQDFIDYISALKKYKSGGYYTFNSKELENYLNYKLSEVDIFNFDSVGN